MIEELKDQDVANTDRCDKWSSMGGICICCECKIREKCGIEKLCHAAGCISGPYGGHFVTKCMTKEKMEGKNVLEENQKARRANTEIRRHTLSNSFLLEE